MKVIGRDPTIDGTYSGSRPNISASRCIALTNSMRAACVTRTRRPGTSGSSSRAMIRRNVLA